MPISSRALSPAAGQILNLLRDRFGWSAGQALEYNSNGMNIQSGSEGRTHPLIRYSDSLVGGIDTIGIHRQEIERNGAVWFAKIGAGVGLRRIDSLNQQALSGNPGYVYLVQKVSGKYVLSRGTVLHAQREFPEEERHLVPLYYEGSGVSRRASTWFKISELLDVSSRECSELVVASTGRAIGPTLQASMASMFYVRRNR